MDIQLKEAHVGKIIKERIEELGLSKSEFGRRAGIPQQHVNRVLERETMETKKLVKICNVLDINIFAKFCILPTSINAYLAAVSTSGDARNYIGDGSAITELEIAKTENKGLLNENKLLVEQIEQLKSHLSAMERMVNLLEKK